MIVVKISVLWPLNVSNHLLSKSISNLFTSVTTSSCRLGQISFISSVFLILSLLQVAVKVIDKTKLDPVARGHLFQEVRCMKMVQHPNVVRLYEVIDTATKLYLILELGDGGDMYDCIMKHDGGLSEEVSGTLGRMAVRSH